MTLEEILSKKTVDFEKEVREWVNAGLSYMDSVIHFSEKYNIDIETVAAYVSKNQLFLAKIQDEAEELHFLPKTNKLPFDV